MRSQDEEQSSDASIERVDEPQNVNTAKDSQIKKDMISTISQEVVKEMTELLNEIPLDPLTSVPSKKSQSRIQSHVPSSKRFLRHFDSQSSEKNQRKTKLQDGKQSSDDASIKRAYKLRKASISKDMRQLEKELDLIEGAIYAITLKEEKKKKYQRLAQVSTDNLNSDIGKEQSTQNNNSTWEDFSEEISRKKLSPQVDPMSYDETPEMFDELRMSCSVTGNQILDEGRRTRDTWRCNNSDIDKTFWSGDQEEEDDDAFEIIQMPASEKKSELSCSEELVAEQRRHDSNRDSPSFELLSDPPSPTCFIHFNEEHFSANEGNAEQQSLRVADSNSSTNSIYVVDIHGKIYNEHQLIDLNEHVSMDLEKRSGGAYSFVTETLPVQGNRCSKSLRSEQRSSEWKNSRDNVCDTRDSASSTYDDVRNSHTSYQTVWTHCDKCSCQSQTDSSDFTQSFHSHTTSVTDTTDIYTEAYSSRYDEQVPTTAKDVREAATTTARATATTTTPRNDHVCVNGSCMEKTKTNERHYNGADNYPKCFCGSHSNTPRGTSVDSPYQSCRASGSSNRSSSNVGSRKSSVGDQTSGTANPVHILPETLVTAATHVGSYAFDTACEMLDKIRAHTVS